MQNLGSSLFGSIGGMFGKFLSRSQNGTCSTDMSKIQQKCIVIPDGKIKLNQNSNSKHIGGLSELIKDRYTHVEDSRNRLHALELLYENDNDDGKMKLEEMEAVKSIYEQSSTDVRLEDIPRPIKNRKKKGKKQRQRSGSNDSTHTV